MEFLLILAGMVVGFGLGIYLRDIKDAIKALQEAQAPKNEPRVTMGAYSEKPKVASSHIVSPKTPQKIEWDAQQEALKEAQQYRVSPK